VISTSNALRKADSMKSNRVSVSLISLVALVVAFLAWAAPAYATQVWSIDSLSATTVAPGGTFEYLVQATNTGDAAMDGSEIDVTGSLPAGITAVDGRLILDTNTDESNFVTCTAGDGVTPLAGASDVRCVDSDPLAGRGSWQLLRLTVRVDPGVRGSLRSSFAVSGGGAPASASTVDPIEITDAPPEFGIDAFDGQVSDAAGNPLTQAGGHPATASVSFGFNTFVNSLPLGGSSWPVEPVRDVFVDLPPGLVGDPTGVDQCRLSELAGVERASNDTLCPSTSQVGTILLRSSNRPLTPESFGPLPVFNMVPPPNAPARFGFLFGGTSVVLDATVRSGGDYGITVNGRAISEALPVAGGTFTFWGVPSDSSHDGERACPHSGGPPGLGGPSCVTNAPRVAFLRNPTMCSDAGLPTTMRIDSWLNPGVFRSFTWRSHLPPGFPDTTFGPEQGPTGCDRVPFDPKLDGQPGQGTPNTPSQFAFDLTLPQTNDPDAIGESDLRTALVTLPAGVRVNPAAADGLQACSSAQIHLHDDEAPACPDAAKVGSVTITTPLLKDPIEGRIYLAAPHDNPFGTLLSIYLVAEGSGVTIKLAGRVEANAVTGQLTATFDDNPQTPFSNLHLVFDGGPRAQLVTPRACGTYTTTATFTGWNGRTVESDPTFTISGDGHGGGSCPGPKFEPKMSAGTASNSAGSFSSMQLRFTRDDLDQEISGLTVNLPSGLTGKIANVDLCGETQAKDGTCPAGSKIGDVITGAGAGTNPFFITDGRAYLTGPYKGAPFGVSIVVPAKAGPFDLGNVVVRSALFVDKHTADVSVVSDPLPTILQGIPLQVRDVRVDVNKPKFFLNPTSCAEKKITGVLTSTEGLKANVSDRFQAADCASLGFRPHMTLRVGGRGHTRRGQTTPVTATVTMPSRNQANLRSVRVSLPTTINARLNTINDACTRAEFEADIKKCVHAIAGTAVASTPLLRAPLRGNVYFVKNGNPLPDLFVALRGQVSFDLIGRITIPGSKHLATTFATAPDVPIRSFTLRLLGGTRTASTGAAKNLCSPASRRATASVDYIAQNGRVLQVNQHLKVGGCAKRHAGGRHRRH